LTQVEVDCMAMCSQSQCTNSLSEFRFIVG